MNRILRSPHAVLRLLAAVTILLFSHSIASAQRFNLIPNGSFEDPMITTCDQSISTVDDLDHWSALFGTPDVQWSGCRKLDWYPSGAGSGRQYVGIFNGFEDDREGITVRLKEPLIVGGTYNLDFLAFTRNALTDGFFRERLLVGKGRIHIHLSTSAMDANNFRQGRMIWGSEDDGKLGQKGKQWNRYRTSFVADQAYEFMAIEVVHGSFNGNNSVALDDMSLVLDDHTCTGNLVPNPSFENPTGGSSGGWPKFWDNIQGDYGAVLHLGSASGDHVMTSAHDGSDWFTLKSFQGTVRANSAVGVELMKPLVPGRMYRLTFHAATKNNLTHNKGEIRVTADTQPITWDWIASGSTIMSDTRIDGDEEEWHRIEQVFVASDAFTHIAFQSRAGYHVDIDNICLTSDPFMPGTIEFTAPDFDVTESAGPGTITLRRVDGNAGTVSVDLQTVAAGGSAIPGVDYTPVSTTVTFADGQMNATVQVPILDDFDKEGNETIALVLTNPTNGATLGLAGARLNIIDDLTGKSSTGGLTLEENIVRRGKIVWASDKTPGGTVGTSDLLYYNEVRSTSPPKAIPGTAGGRDPVWSHDGRYIAYVVRVTGSSPGTIGLSRDCLKIIDQQGNVYASWFAPTILGEQFFGAPDWSDDGSRIAIPYYTFWPTTGLATIDFATPYNFTTAGTTMVIPESAGATALDPAFMPGGGALYFHGHPNSGSYGASSFLFRQSLSPGALPAVVSGNGSVIDNAFSPSVDRSGGKLIFGSSAWQNDPYGIFEEEEILSLDIASGVMTRTSEESENDFGRFARGSLARDQFVRQNNANGGRNLLILQRGTLVMPFNTDDSSNIFNDHAPDWVIPKVDIWNLTGTYEAGIPGAIVTWSDVIVDPVDPQNPDVFMVQRSPDGVLWSVVGQVQRTGTELTETSYSFIDISVECLMAPRVMFYRVGMADAVEPSGYSWSLPVEVTIPPCEQEGGPDLE